MVGPVDDHGFIGVYDGEYPAQDGYVHTGESVGISGAVKMLVVVPDIGHDALKQGYFGYHLYAAQGMLLDRVVFRYR